MFVAGAALCYLVAVRPPGLFAHLACRVMSDKKGKEEKKREKGKKGKTRAWGRPLASPDFVYHSHACTSYRAHCALNHAGATEFRITVHLLLPSLRFNANTKLAVVSTVIDTAPHTKREVRVVRACERIAQAHKQQRR